MTAFIIALGVMAIVHFVYESIIAPSLRVHLRNELFELRDASLHTVVAGIQFTHADGKACAGPEVPGSTAHGRHNTRS